MKTRSSCWKGFDERGLVGEIQFEMQHGGGAAEEAREDCCSAEEEGLGD